MNKNDLKIPKDLDLNQFIELIKSSDLNLPKSEESLFLTKTKQSSFQSYSAKFKGKRVEKHLSKDENNNSLTGPCTIDLISKESKFIRLNEGINLKKSIKAREYFQCSVKEISTIESIFTSAINVGVNYKIFKESKLAEKKSNPVDEKKDFDKTDHSEQKSKQKENENICSKQLLKKNRNEKKDNIFSNIFKLKCLSCTRSETLNSICSHV